MYILSSFFANFLLLQNEGFTGDTFPQVVDIITDSFKVGGGVVGARDEDLVVGAVFSSDFQWRHGNKPIERIKSKFEGGQSTIQGR